MATGIKDKVAVLGMGCARFGERWESSAEDLARTWPATIELSVVALALGYVSVLFALAWYADKRVRSRKAGEGRPFIYSLSLAVYCTAWTYFGSVGRAAAAGIAPDRPAPDSGDRRIDRGVRLRETPVRPV